jgi:hypothetical protein
MKTFRQLSWSFVRHLPACLTLAAAAHAATISFVTDPFAGTDALTTPGRQIVGNELFTDFNVATDVFSFDSAAFGMQEIVFANDEVGNLATSGLNVVVLQTFDPDGDPTTPFLAGTAANLLAAQLTSPGPGLFIYFNSNLDLPRLVYSTNLSDNTSDLKILARLTNFGGSDGRDALAGFTAQNFQIATVPDSSGGLTVLLALAAITGGRRFMRIR